MAAGRIVRALPKRRAYLDPFSGPAVLLEHAVPHGCERHAIEIDPMWEEELARRGVQYRIADSFAVEWPDMPIITNVPYGRMEDAIRRVINHVDTHRTFALLLNRTDYFQHPGRLEPDLLAMLKWRPMFGYQADHRTKRPRMGSDVAGYTWAGFGDVGAVSGLFWLDKPTATSEAKREHRRLAMMAFEAANVAVAP